MPDNEKTGNSWEAGACVNLDSLHHHKNSFHESCLEKTWFTLIHNHLLQSPRTATLLKTETRKSQKRRLKIL